MGSNLRVVFYNRDFSGTVQPSAEVRVERYSWDMTGGPKAASLSAALGGDEEELTKLLRCPVEIHGGDGRLNWWGFVNKVSIPYGNMMVGVGLDSMYNTVEADWSDGDTDGTTAQVTDPASVHEFGIKQQRLSLDNVNATNAANMRDIYLAGHKWPKAEVELSGGKRMVVLECKGWWETLGWKYYTNAGTDNVEDTAQITTIVAGDSLLEGALIRNLSGLTSSEERDGKSTALSYVEALLDAGTTNVRPLVATVDTNRVVVVTERSAEPAQGRADYLLGEDGNLYAGTGAQVPPEWCTCSAWAAAKGLAGNLPGMMAIPPFFIESADYDATRDKCTYRPADAFEPHRLDKYVQQESGGGGGSTGGTVEPPVEGGGGRELIEEVVTSGGTDTVTFSSIPGTYKKLTLEFAIRSDYNSLTDQLLVRLNGDTGVHYVIARTITKLNSDDVSQTATGLLFAMCAGQSLSGSYTIGKAELIQYATAGISKQIAFDAGSLVDTTANQTEDQGKLAWTGTDAVTSITLLVNSGYFVDGSIVRLYGEN